MYTLKTPGIILNMAALIVIVCAFTIQWQSNGGLCVDADTTFSQLIICAIIHLAVTLYIIFSVKKEASSAMAKRYAYALLETIDIM